ncbi:MAG: ribosomal L7Ae/L30e/S12e/Gadd45 family protein [Candidatus Micrarchaeota archaeon]|nr:ribosomal L7Ae/L30e/S12e/Gadd45 family protein [Candidatus Micrarchaeota archaeon]MCX8154458.1 ribosomal L7Ae/L30e/S12e/Gadd45 family protein [Candidatus Micrarchaeota archaeon]
MKVPDEVKAEVLNVLQEISNAGGKIRAGVNEVTKSIQRGTAKLVVVAEDVNPPEIVAHLPKLAKEKRIHLVYVKSKDDLGKASGKGVSASSVAVIDPGKAKDVLERLLAKLPKVE